MKSLGDARTRCNAAVCLQSTGAHPAIWRLEAETGHISRPSRGDAGQHWRPDDPASTGLIPASYSPRTAVVDAADAAPATAATTTTEARQHRRGCVSAGRGCVSAGRAPSR